MPEETEKTIGFKINDPETLKKLEKSLKAARTLQKRKIYCPVCGKYLLDVYGHEHFITAVKCQKCKFNKPIDTAFFRTLRSRMNNYQKRFFEEKGKEK